MSKIIDALNRNLKSNTEIDDSVQEKLAKTFFTSSTKKGQEKRKVPKIPWLIAAITPLLLLLIIISTSFLDIKVEVTKRAPPISLVKSIFFTNGGEPNENVIQEASFLGDADRFSRKKDDMLILVNSKGAGWASFSMTLRGAVDFEKLNIAYSAKGQIGDERLILVLIDTENKSYRTREDLSSALTKEWEEYVINLRPLKDAIDLSNISTIQFEFGTLTAGNDTTATIFLKDINARKAKR